MPITKLHGWQIEYLNEREYHVLKQEIFGRDIYWFEPDTASPRILDIGAHIGLASLYFLTQAPGAHITAVEPNPYIAEVLERNLWQNQVDDRVSVEKVAVSTESGQTDLYIDSSPDQWWSTASLLPAAWTGDQATYPLTVPMKALREFLTDSIDLLKMDIEGAEQAVLMSAGLELVKVRQLLVEFHPHPQQSLSILCKYLTNLGFTVSVWKKGKPVSIAAAGNGLVMIRAARSDRA